MVPHYCFMKGEKKTAKKGKHKKKMWTQEKKMGKGWEAPSFKASVEETCSRGDKGKSGAKLAGNLRGRQKHYTKSLERIREIKADHFQ